MAAGMGAAHEASRRRGSTTPGWRLLLVAVPALVGSALACSPGESRTGASAADADLRVCLPGNHDVTVLWMQAARGLHGITGTVLLPATTGDRATQFQVDQTSPFPGGSQIVGTFKTRPGATTVTFRLSDVPDGTYRLRFRVDETGNGRFGDPGDIEGYFDGTSSRPLLSHLLARTIRVEGTCVTGADFGVGLIN
jgi:hypothetical protein